MVGLGDNDIENLFEKVDANGDGIVMRFEVHEAFQDLARLESNMGRRKCTRDFGGFYGGGLNGCEKRSLDCCESKCKNCDCPNDC